MSVSIIFLFKSYTTLDIHSQNLHIRKCFIALLQLVLGRIHCSSSTSPLGYLLHPHSSSLELDSLHHLCTSLKCPWGMSLKGYILPLKDIFYLHKMLKLLLLTLTIWSSLSYSEGIFFGSGTGTCPSNSNSGAIGAITSIFCIPCTSDSGCFGLLCCPSGTRSCCRLPSKTFG